MMGLVLLGIVSSATVQPVKAAESEPGLTVHRGELWHDGKPYRGIGVNYFSLAGRLLNNPADTSSLTNLAALAKAGVPFVRFMCGGFWPTEQKLYLTNREVFFQRLDRVVRCAEENHIGLIPSLFWNIPTFPDLVGEPMQELGNTNSRSIALIRDYTAEVVRRYRQSPALWAWEFGNEGTLMVDLPNAPTQHPPVVPQLGTPTQRSERDELGFAHLQVAYLEFARTVRKWDPTRLIVSGNAIPRNSAWHNSEESSWTNDDAKQYAEILRRDNPDPMDGISVHIYPSESYPAGVTNLAEIIQLTARIAVAAKKPLFIGEFGVGRDAGPIEVQKRRLNETLVALKKFNVPLAALWVFDLPDQEKDWNISFHNDRAPLLHMVAEANRR